MPVALNVARETAAQAEMEHAFSEQRKQVSSVLDSTATLLQQRLSERNDKLPAGAASIALLSHYRSLQGKLVLRARCSVNWTSFGYDVAHLSSCSKGGEAGTHIHASDFADGLKLESSCICAHSFNWTST